MDKDAKHNRNLEWPSYKGTILLKKMDDTHVVNVVHMLNIRKKKTEEKLEELIEAQNAEPSNFRYDFMQSRLEGYQELIDNFEAEMKFRKIPLSALEKAPYEFLDEEGCKRLWDEEKKEFKISPPSARFIKED